MHAPDLSPGLAEALGDAKTQSRQRQLERLIRPTMAMETPPEHLTAEHGESARGRGEPNDPMGPVHRRRQQEPCWQDRRASSAPGP